MSTDGRLVVAAARQLAGVSTVEALDDPSGRVTQIRVGLAAGADWQAVEAAVRRLVLASSSTPAAAERVRVVPIMDDVPPPRASSPRRVPSSCAPAARVQVAGIDLVTAGSEVTATVVLSAGSGRATGSCSGAVAGSGVLRAVATAALLALEELVADSVRLEVEEVEVRRTREPAIAVVLLGLASEQTTQRLAGAARVRHDQADAVVRAVLDASNRRMASLLR